MESISGLISEINSGSRDGLYLFDLLEDTGLYDGVRHIGDAPNGIEIELGKGSALELAIRNGTPAGKAFIGAAARAGFDVVLVPLPSVTVVRLSRQKGRG